MELGLPPVTEKGPPSTRLPLKVHFAVVDVETTGLFPARDRIVELAVNIVDHRGARLDGFETLINPERDMGATHIHGITAEMARGGPRFRDIAGDLLAYLGAGSIWVGHNVAFDLRFIETELNRVGLRLAPTPVLCTLSLARRLYPGLGSHRLECVCQHLGIPCCGQHAAGADAVATAALLGRLLGDSARCSFDIWSDEQLALVRSACDASREPEHAALNRTTSPFLMRGQAQVQAQAGRRSYIDRLLQNLRPCGGFLAADDKTSLYLRLLDRALEDRRINDIEQAELLPMAEAWGLGVDDVLRAHDIYLGMLVKTALEDGVVTANEQADLDRVCDLLGLDRERLKQLLAEGRSAVGAGIDMTIGAGFAEHADLSDLSVCFTGITPGPLGEPMSRDEAERLATAAGLHVAKSVTKKLDLLVVADPDTQSDKAKKARSYGTRIMAAEVFWKSIAHRARGDR